MDMQVVSVVTASRMLDTRSEARGASSRCGAWPPHAAATLDAATTRVQASRRYLPTVLPIMRTSSR
jgi:hypothetical protein